MFFVNRAKDMVTPLSGKISELLSSGKDNSAVNIMRASLRIPMAEVPAQEVVRDRL